MRAGAGMEKFGYTAVLQKWFDRDSNVSQPKNTHKIKGVLEWEKR
jgi:hypothetical protein